jgi:hypothetical protein
LLLFQVIIAVRAGATLMFAFQSPNHMVLPLFFVFLLALLGGVDVASLGAFSDEVLLQRKILRLRRPVFDLISLHSPVGVEWHNPGGIAASGKFESGPISGPM